MDQSDIEYAEIVRELKTEIFHNRCQQERLREHLWRLEKKPERCETEENRTSTDLEEELRSKDSHLRNIKEKLEGLEKRLRVLQATASVEEFFQNKADEVGYAVVGSLSVHVLVCL